MNQHIKIKHPELVKIKKEEDIQEKDSLKEDEKAVAYEEDELSLEKKESIKAN